MEHLFDPEHELVIFIWKEILSCYLNQITTPIPEKCDDRTQIFAQEMYLQTTATFKEDYQIIPPVLYMF